LRACPAAQAIVFLARLSTFLTFVIHKRQKRSFPSDGFGEYVEGGEKIKVVAAASSFFKMGRRGDGT